MTDTTHPQHQTPNTGEDKCRAEFEKWYDDGNGCYGLKEDLWFVWQAAIEHVKSQAVITDERPAPADTSLMEKLKALAAEFEYADPRRAAVDEAIAIVRQHQPAQPVSLEEVEESGGKLLQRLGMDGKLWAEEMHKRFPSVAEDELLGWCCNMIMAGYDEASRRWALRTPTEAELLEATSALYGCREVLGNAANIQCAIEGLEAYLPSKD